VRAIKTSAQTSNHFLPQPLLSAICCVFLIHSCGCSTHSHRLQQPRQLFYTNQLDQAHDKLGKLSEKMFRNDKTVIELDLAMVELLSGNPAAAEQRLRDVRDRWDHLEQASAVESAASMLTDDQRKAYSGEDYEKLLVRVFLTMCSLMKDGVDAESYSLQTLDKHADLVNKAHTKWGDPVLEAYRIPPIAPYMRGLLREATLSNYDDALSAYQSAEALLPGHPTILEDIERVTTGVHSPPGHGVVYIFAMVGRGPYKVEVAAQATSDALLIADRIVSVLGKYSVPPTLAPVKVPEIESPPLPFQLVGVMVNGKPVTTTRTLTDLHLLATQTFHAKLPEVMARAVARRVVKKGAVYVAKDQLNASAPLASLAMDGLGVAWEATESADTRCWGLLPREIQMVRLELPIGTHAIALEPVNFGRPCGPPTHCTVRVEDGRNAYVLGYWPDHQPIGKVLVSNP
jgi:uncharacterized protein